jgi:intracellular septation protein A
MSLPAPVAAAHATPSAERHCPNLGAIIRRVSVSLVIACAVPAVVFYTTFRLYGVWIAIVAALCWSYGAIAWRALTGRRTSGLLILTTAVLTLRTTVALLTDSTFLYFLQPIITDALIGTVFMASALTARPMVGRLAGDFYPMDDELACRPRVRQLFRHLTVLWASLALAKAAFTYWLLQSQSVDTFLLVKSLSMPSINASAVAATIGLAVLVGRREGLLRPRPAL